MVGRSTRRPRPAKNRRTTPTAAIESTANRFTPQAWERWNEPNDDTREARTCGCDVWAMAAIIEVNVPGCPWTVPSQKPRPGHACRAAKANSSPPIPPSTTLPSRLPVQAASGSATRPPATA